jgi:hypothetical protein
MGNLSSSSGPVALTQEQQDLRDLASKFAFGDDELRHVYRAYQQLLLDRSTAPVSFVQDWGIACYDPPPDHEALEGAVEEEENDEVDRDNARDSLLEERKRRLRQADSLLGDFGNRLYAKVFLASGDVSKYGNSADPGGAGTATSTTHLPSSPSLPLADEYTRKSRLEAVFEGLAACSRRGSQATLMAMFRVLEDKANQQGGGGGRGGRGGGAIDALELVTLGYRLALATAVLCHELDELPPAFDHPSSHTALRSFAGSLMERAESHRQRYGGACAVVDGNGGDGPIPAGHVQLTELLEFVDVSCPVFASILPSFLWQVFFPNRPYPPSRTAFAYPRLLLSPPNTSVHSCAASSGGTEDDEDRTSKIDEEYADRLLNPVFRYVLACWSSSLNGPYVPLFNSEQDGLSFNRLQNALVGYSGPTLLVISARSGNMFGAFTSSKWREAKDFYGTSETFLYALSPCSRVYRPTLRNERYQYCNSSARSKGYDQQAHGLGFGGTVQRPRLFLSETFEDCTADRQDLTFDNGPLVVFPTDDDGVDGASSSLSASYFTPDSLQVWAVGGQAVVEAALQDRGQHRDVVEQGIRRARKVDKAQFLDDLRAGVIESKAFAHRQQIDGRADQDVAERVQHHNDANR